MEYHTDVAMIVSILSFLPFSLINSSFSSFSSMITEWVQKKKWIDVYIPSSIIEVVGMNTLLDASFLQCKDEYIGFTGYIDRIQAVEDSIMIGCDPYDRAFITIQTPDSSGKNNVVVLFQRYSDVRDTWTYGARSSPCWMNRFAYFCQRNIIHRVECIECIKSVIATLSCS